MWLLSACTAASVTKEPRFEFHLILINLNSGGHSCTCLVATKSDSTDLANAIARREQTLSNTACCYFYMASARLL